LGLQMGSRRLGHWQGHPCPTSHTRWEDGERRRKPERSSVAMDEVVRILPDGSSRPNRVLRKAKVAMLNAIGRDGAEDAGGHGTPGGGRRSTSMGHNKLSESISMLYYWSQSPLTSSSHSELSSCSSLTWPSRASSVHAQASKVPPSRIFLPCHHH